MKKNLLLVLALFIAGGVFAQEYTIYLAGTLRGFITVQKDRNGKITIAPSLSSDGWAWIGNSICPILPKEGFTIWKTTKSIVIDGNTTTETSADGKWNRTVIDRNTTTYTTSDGYWTKTVTEGNTITFTSSRGRSAITGLEGNTLTKTYPNETLTITHYDSEGRRTTTDSYENWWQKVVVSGNTMTETDSSGSWSRAVINGNTTTVTKNGELSYEEVIRGNTRTLTYSYGGGYREVVDGNTITITSLDGKREEVIDKQGNDVFLTLTGAYSFDDIEEAVPKLKFWNSDLRFKGKSGPDFSPIRPLFPRACGKTIGFWNRLEVSEKDRVKNTIDGITSGRLKDGKFYELIDYGR